MRVAGWLPLAGLLLAVPVPAARLAAAGWPPHQGLRGAAAALKRHSEGTFTSDFTHYLDKLKAKDFVHWLIDTKRYSSTKRDLEAAARGLPLPAGRA